MNEVWFKGKKHLVLTEGEASVRGISIAKDWRTADVGEWIRTDTGRVVQLLDKGCAGSTPWVRSCCGTFPARPDDLLCHRARENRYNFSGLPPAWSVTRKVEAFARLYARCGDPVQAFKMAFPKARSQKYIKIKGSKFLELPAVQEVVKDERQLILAEIGIDRKDIMMRMKAMLDDLEGSERTEKMNLKFRILRYFDESLDKVGAEVSTEITKTDTFEITGTALDAVEHGAGHQTRIKQVTKVRVGGEVDVEGMTGGQIHQDDKAGDSGEVFPG